MYEKQKSKYRVLEKDGVFYPQEKILWFFWSYMIKTDPGDDIAKFSNLESAKTFLTQISKPAKPSKVIHNYP